MRTTEIRAIPVALALMTAAACGSGSSAAEKDDAQGGDIDRSANAQGRDLVPAQQHGPAQGHFFLASHVCTSLFYDRLTEGGKQVTFTLRDDAKFWDGTPVDGAAVKASLDRARTVESTTASAALSMI